MSDAASSSQTAPQNAAGRQAGNAANRVVELRVSGNLMRLETGVYCIVNKPVPHADQRSGMPGVRLSPAPGVDSRPEQVEITTFRDDGWLSGFGDAALVRVAQGPAHIMVTVYQDPAHPEQAPNIQVVKLLDRAPPRAGAGRAPQPAGPMDEAQGSAHVAAAASAAPGQGNPRVMDMVAHIQGQGDVGAVIEDRLGEVGSKRWIEGFAIAPMQGVAPSDIEYQAVLGRGWLSPWVEGGEFCGSRGMALPVLGLRLRLRGDAARDWECSYSASFTDGTEVGPVAAGAACEAESLAPLESFQIHLRRRGQAAVPARPAAAVPAPAAPVAMAPVAGPARAAVPKPAAAKPGPKASASKADTPKAPAPKASAAKAPASKAPASKAPAPKTPAKPAPRRR